jgi:TetR/AcrR family transcriptional repressor of nem operon
MRPPTRQKIVTAAEDRFHIHGYSACSVQDIVDQAGVPKGSFYNHFKTKELMAVEVLANYVDSSKREILTDEAFTPLERIRRHFRFFIERYERNGFSRGCLIGNLSAESSEATPILRKALSDSLSTWTELLAAAIDQGQRSGEIRIGAEPVQVARFLVNSWEGSVLRMKLTASREPLDDFFEISMAFLGEPSSPM